MSPQLAEAFARLPAYLGGHVAVSVTALLLGLAISLPLALIATRRPALRNVLLGAASVVQTIPSLALLALFYPLLLGLAALCERLFGAGFSALGFPPSVLALTLYSMLPVLRNTITGLNGVDPAINEAALGVGMTPRQSLAMVELPLALPVIMAGIRTAAIWVIGAAITFWTIETSDVTQVFTYGGQLLISYPMSIYADGLRRFFTFVVPLAFVAYLPCLYILERPDPLGLPPLFQVCSPVVALAFLLAARGCWALGVRQYQGTGS